MSTIPTSITEKQFEEHVRPYISTAQRGYECKIPLYKVFNYILYRKHTGCPWHQLPIERDPQDEKRPEISHDAVAYHFRNWSRDGSLARVFAASIQTIADALDLSEINQDGSHAIAKKGGESVAYQRRKRAKTTNILPFTDANGFIIATTGVVAGNHHDAWQLKEHLQEGFKFMKQLGLSIEGAFFNADPAFDTKDARKTCFNHGLIPNIKENPRSRKSAKRGPTRFFDREIYKHRFVSERTFAWVDKFRTLLLRFDRLDACFLGAHFIAFSMINLRHILASP
ncbi:MAG: IS5 family transposase [Caldilineaceae bacterium]|nr:IS5 family transposase [Caldilineaceae bacterium]MCB0187734.1 IS5 family transposase [Caldilineaceae bacterium]